MSALLDLADRCEKAMGADRELDAEIAVAAKVVPYDFEPAFGAGWWRGKYDDRHWQAPEFTASIDAAMTLAMPNWWFSTTAPLSEAAYGHSREDQRAPRAGFEMIGPPYSVGAQAATIPLAICAAALRARAAITPETANG